MMSMLCNCCIRELLILARTWFAFGLPSKTGCDTYQEYTSKVLDCKERSTRAKSIKMNKIQWSNHSEEEATWETEEFLRSNFPDCLHKEIGT
jgi:hypothetical protein